MAADPRRVVGRSSVCSFVLDKMDERPDCYPLSGTPGGSFGGRVSTASIAWIEPFDEASNHHFFDRFNTTDCISGMAIRN